MATGTESAAGAVAGYKLALLGIPFIAALLGFWLGLRFIPLREGYEAKDMINRVMACALSSFVVGLPALVLLHNKYPSAYTSMLDLARLAGLDPVVGLFAFCGCVFLVASMPGPWLVAAAFRWIERRKDKDLGELVDSARASLGNKP